MSKNENELAESGSVADLEEREHKPLISLCMIARDNELTIANALASAKPWVDEIIVVDTGSTDRTPEIAREFGARVESFAWCDDFSAARNQSLNYATGEWIFWMDTDDELPEKCGEILRQTLSSRVSDGVLGYIMQVRCPRITNPGLKTEDPSLGNSNQVVVDHVKVFRNRDDLRFEGRIHEQILTSIRQVGGRVLWMDNYVVHSGADQSPEGIKGKLDRDLRILRVDIKERPEHPFVHFNLGMTLLHLGEFEEAQSALENCVSLSVTKESHLRKAYALWVDTLEHLDATEAKRRCWEGLGRYPNDAELAFKLGRLLMLDQQWEQAADAFERIGQTDEARYFSSMDSGIKGHKSFANLAICYTELEDRKKAIDAWRSCLKYAPGFVEAWEGILELALETGDLETLKLVVDEFRNEDEARILVMVGNAIVAAAEKGVDAAIECFEKCLEEAGKNSFALNQYARFLNECQGWAKSIPVLERLHELDPNNPSPRHNLGVALFQLGRSDDATLMLQESLDLRPGHQPTLDLLTRCANFSQVAQ